MRTAEERTLFESTAWVDGVMITDDREDRHSISSRENNLFKNWKSSTVVLKQDSRELQPGQVGWPGDAGAQEQWQGCRGAVEEQKRGWESLRGPGSTICLP